MIGGSLPYLKNILHDLHKKGKKKENLRKGVERVVDEGRMPTY